jgi:hypothetical protein
MKKLNVVFLFITFLMFFSCEQNEVEITEPVTINFTKKVLVENFVGVRIISIQSGAEELDNLKSLYGDDLIIVSIPSSDFGQPFPSSQHDFRITEGEEITEYIGHPLGYPSAVINRKDFDGGDYFLPKVKSFWAEFIDQEIGLQPKLSVIISKNYDSLTRELSVQISGEAKVDIIGDLKLNILITESNIVDSQEVLDVGVVENYVHNHVLKTTMTESTGDNLAINLMNGATYEKNYSMILPDDWDESNCEVIAFVNLIDGQQKEILQVESTQVEN